MDRPAAVELRFTPRSAGRHRTAALQWNRTADGARIGSVGRAPGNLVRSGGAAPVDMGLKKLHGLSGSILKVLFDCSK